MKTKHIELSLAAAIALSGLAHARWAQATTPIEESAAAPAAAAAIVSIPGPAGVPGPQGPRGPQGIAGPAGAPGVATEVAAIDALKVGLAAAAHCAYRLPGRLTTSACMAWYAGAGGVGALGVDAAYTSASGAVTANVGASSAGGKAVYRVGVGYAW